VSVGSRGVGQEGVEVYENFCELGTGSIDFKRVFQVLEKSGYDGYICTELDISRFGNKKSAEINYKYIIENIKDVR
jgi:sugar phosphate isomerase/epimerase